jgi:hypothetical protein
MLLLFRRVWATVTTKVLMLENRTTANFNASNIHANLYTTMEAESTVEVNQVQISAFV